MYVDKIVPGINSNMTYDYRDKFAYFRQALICGIIFVISIVLTTCNHNWIVMLYTIGVFYSFRAAQTQCFYYQSFICILLPFSRFEFLVNVRNLKSIDGYWIYTAVVYVRDVIILWICYHASCNKYIYIQSLN